jgi:TadE-like protein
MRLTVPMAAGAAGQPSRPGTGRPATGSQGTGGSGMARPAPAYPGTGRPGTGRPGAGGSGTACPAPAYPGTNHPGASRPPGAGPPQAVTRPAPDRERGSMAVEFVILAPLMILLMLFLVLCGRVIEAHGQVDGAARDAARAASIARTLGQATAGARQAARGDLNGWCAGNAPTATVNGFGPGSGQVTVIVTCRVSLQFISFGSIRVTGSAVAPLDTFVARS